MMFTIDLLDGIMLYSLVFLAYWYLTMLTHTQHTFYRDLKCMCTHNKISQLKELQRRTLFWSGAAAFIKYIGTLCYPPIIFLFLRLKRNLDFGVGGMHANGHIFEQNAPQTLLFKMVPKENFLLVGCSSLYIVY